MGRAAVDLYAQQIGASLETVTTFAKYVGGCPANIAIGASRLGLKTGIFSGVGDEAMGRFVRETMIHENVDVSYLYTKPDHLTGLVLLGIDPPDRFPLIFYRQNCSDMALTEEDVAHDMFQKTKALLFTGTHCSTPDIFAVTKKAVTHACESGCEVILDIDYRPVLWGAAGHGEGEERFVAHEVVSQHLAELLPHCSIIVGTEEEIQIAGGLKRVQSLSNALIVQKRGEAGCLVYQGEQIIEGAPFPIEVTNVLGAGDAFMSGFLRGYLRSESLKTCCDLANANGALVVKRHGCAPAMPYWNELQSFLKNRCLKTTESLHTRLGRQPVDKLFLLAIDHRSYFDQWPEEQTVAFKQIVREAFEQVSETNKGIITDHGPGDFRCIEKPGAVPLEFLNGEEARHILESWPKQIGVKVLCPLTDDHTVTLQQLKRLHIACLSTDRELLIEFIDPSLTKIAHIILLCYQNDIQPDWWKLPPHSDPISWAFISKLIDRHDPHCKGILLLGQNQTINGLVAMLKQWSTHIRGFAVGRSIWGAAAEKFKAGSEEDLKTDIINNFTTLVRKYNEHACRSDDQNSYAHNRTSPYSLPHEAKR